MLLKLTLYEWRKLFSGSFIKILLVVLLITNAVLSAMYADKWSAQYNDSDYRQFVSNAVALFHEDPDEFYSEFEQSEEDLDEDKYTVGPYGNDRFHQYFVMKKALSLVEADRDYHEKMDLLISRASTLMTNYRLDGKENSFNYRYQAQVAEIYGRLNETVTIEPSLVSGWYEYFSYQNEFFLVFIMLAALAVNAVMSDRQRGFYPIISTCCHGRAHTVLAKCLTVAVSSLVIVLLFTTTTLLSIGYVCGYSDVDGSIQALRDMTNYPAAFSVGGALLLSVLVKVLSAILFAMLVFAFTSLLKNALFGYFVGILIVVSQLVGADLDVLIFGQWKFLNLWCLYVPNLFLSRYRAVGIFSRSVDLFALFIVLFAAIVVAVVGLSCYVYHRNAAALRLSAVVTALQARVTTWVSGLFSRMRRSAASDDSLLRHELYKHRTFYLILVVLILLKCYSSVDFYSHEESAYDRVYEKYAEKVSGEYTEEKLAYLSKELAKNDEIVSRMSDMDKQLLQGLITQDEYREYYAKYAVAELNRTALKELTITANYLKALNERGIAASFVYEPGYVQYSLQGIDWLLIVAVVLFSCRFYLAEYEASVGSRNTMMLVRSTAKGRGALLWRKMEICLATVTVVWVIFAGIDFYCLMRSYELPEMSALLVSMIRYASAPSSLTVGTYTILAELAGLAGVWILSILCFFVAWLVKKTIYTYAILSLIMVVPTVAASAGIGVASRVDLTMLQNTDALFRYSLAEHQSPVWFVVFLAAAALLAIVMAVICTCRIRKGGKA